MRTKILILFLFFCTSLQLFAQNFAFEHLNEQNGLPQINIRTIHQGKLGFIWIGTENGIFRYDGYVFESFFEADGKNEINLSVIDINGIFSRIAVLTEEKILLIGNKDQNITHINIPNNLLIKPQKILALREEILIGSENGLWRMDVISAKFEKTEIEEPVTGIVEFKPGKIMISTAEGLYFYYPFTHKLIRIAYEPNSYVKHLLVEKNDTVAWLEGDNYFHRGKVNGKNLIPFKSQLLTRGSNSTCLVKYGDLFLLGLKEGLLCIQPNGQEKLITHDDEFFQSLSQNHVSSLLVDRSNKLWVGTLLGGINLHNPFRHKFGLVSYLTSSQHSKCREILSFAETSTGEILFQNSVGGIGHFDPGENKIRKWVSSGVKGNCIVPDVSNPDLFLIGSPEGLLQYDMAKEHFQIINTKNNVKNFESDVKSIIHQQGNDYWMGGEDGLFLFDNEKKQTKVYYGIGNSQLGSDNIRSLHRKSPNEIFVATKAGLYLFNIRKETFQLILLNHQKKQSLISNVKYSNDGNLWIGTSNDGLYILNKDNNLQHINSEKGLKNNQIYSLQMDAEGLNCWVGTNGGLSKINTRNFQVTNFELHDGIQGSDFIESSSLLSKSGMLYFGGIAGFNYFYPAAIINDTNDCVVKIKSLSVFNKKEKYQDYYLIPQEKNYLSFEFAALDYYLIGTHSYFYQLEGLQDQWTEIGDRRFASFGQLRQGDYVFRVKAKNPDGKMGKGVAVVYFSIVPSFYQTLWFKILLILSVAGSIAFFIYYRMQSAIKEEQDKGKQSKMIAELELKALRAQMNPHFIFNSLNSIQEFVLNNEGHQAAKYLSKFAKLIRMILDISEQTFVSIQSKIEFLQIYIELEGLRLNNSFQFYFEIDPEIDQEALMPTLLIQPHIENAIWHGLQNQTGEKKLWIRMKKLNDHMILVEVEDNGVGRSTGLEIKKSKMKIHESRGGKITEDRISGLNKLFGSKPKISIVDLFDENNLACGTKVIMKIPIIHG